VGGGAAPCSPFAGSCDTPSSPLAGALCPRLVGRGAGPSWPWVGGWLCAVFAVRGVQWAFVGGGTALCSPFAGSCDAPSSLFVGAPCSRLPFVGTGEVGVVLRVRDWWGVVLGRYGRWWGGGPVLCSRFVGCSGPSSL
jgi:hypothetical protein